MNRSIALIEAIRGEVSLESVPAPSTVGAKEVHLKPTDLLPVLNQYLHGRLSAEVLRDWASWVLCQEDLSVEGWQSDSVADHYEPMWYVLQQLSTPFIDGEISKELVREHVATLQAL